MASPIAHIRIAADLLEGTRALEATPFLVGNLAPDAGRPTADGGFDPPRAVTHWLANGLSEAAETFRREYMEARLASADRAEASFLAGYYVHLYTDYLWSEFWIARRGEDFGRDPAELETLKEECYLFDRMYLLAHPESVFFTRLMRLDRFPHTLPYFPRGEIEAWVRAVVRNYGEPRRVNYKREFVYLTDPELSLYLRESTRLARQKLAPVLKAFPRQPAR